MLLLDRLTKHFGEVTALDGCRLMVARGEMLWFLGPNGAGKTTAMRSVFDLVVPDSGTVQWDGRPVRPEDRLRFGYMPEERGLYPRMRIHEQVIYFGRLHGMSHTDASDAAARLLTEFGLGDRLEARVDELSHGNQQRVQLAVAMVHDPELLVLDEPFSGLDPVAAGVLAGVLRDRAASGTAVLFSSHQLDLVEHLCDEVVILHRGRVVAEGQVDELRASLPWRYLEVGIRGGTGVDWNRLLDLGRPVEVDTDRLRMVIEGHIDLERVSRVAAGLGEVVEFSVRPPDLSEVFNEVAGS